MSVLHSQDLVTCSVVPQQTQPHLETTCEIMRVKTRVDREARNVKHVLQFQKTTSGAETRACKGGTM